MSQARYDVRATRDGQHDPAVIVIEDANALAGSVVFMLRLTELAEDPGADNWGEDSADELEVSMIRSEHQKEQRTEATDGRLGRGRFDVVANCRPKIPLLSTERYQQCDVY